MDKPISIGKHIGYLFEAVILLIFFAVFRLLPLDWASALGGKLGQWIGPHLKWQKVANYNMRMAFPKWDEAQYAQTLDAMWNNLGRTFAETPWLGSKAMAKRITISAEARAEIHHHRDNKSGCIFFGGHLANWEVVPWVGGLTDTPITSIYRHVNNPYVDSIYRKIRGRYCAELKPKGKRGAKALLKTMRNGGQAGLLVDQKQNDGLKIDFFNHPAATSPAAAEMALRFNATLAPIRCIRQDGCHFTVEVGELKIKKTDKVETVMRKLNQQLESWITQHPDQWLWVHQRWGKLSELPPVA